MEPTLRNQFGNTFVEVPIETRQVRKYTKEQLERHIADLDANIAKFQSRRAYYQSLIDLYGAKQ